MTPEKKSASQKPPKSIPVNRKQLWVDQRRQQTHDTDALRQKMREARGGE